MTRTLFPLSFKLLILSLVLVFSGIFASNAAAEKYASIVIDTETDEVLHARHADAERYPASLTKIMTLYMLFDALKSGEVTLNEKLPVSRRATWQAPSRLALRAGSTISVTDAINALVTKSANDVAVVVAERLGGSESRFAALMTVKAQSLGMTNTVFTNASGLPDNRQHSTARDLAIMSEHLLTEHADYYSYFSTTRFSWGGRTYKNHNELLGDVEGVDGIKTGYTRASGFNLIASAKRDGHRIIVVMLGGATSRTRNAHVEALIEAAYDAIELTPAETQGMNTRIAFQSVTQPIDPLGAAIPLLNGKPLMAQGDTDIAEATQEVLIAEVSIEVETMVTAEIATPAPAYGFALNEPVVEVESAAEEVPVEVVSTVTAEPMVDVAAYEAGQIAAPSIDIAAYEAAQFGKN